MFDSSHLVLRTNIHLDVWHVVFGLFFFSAWESREAGLRIDVIIRVYVNTLSGRRLARRVRLLRDAFRLEMQLRDTGDCELIGELLGVGDAPVDVVHCLRDDRWQELLNAAGI